MFQQLFTINLFTLFLFFGLIQPNLSFTLNKLSSIEKRQNDNATQNEPYYYWPRIDGPLEEAEALLNATPPVLEPGYWTFNATFQIETFNISQKDPKDALDVLFEAMEEYQSIWLTDCVELSNKTAKENGRTNTLARIICFPYNDPTLQIDKKYIAKVVEVGCWERDMNGDPNVPLFDHTEELLKKRKWDKEDALKQVKEIEKQLPPAPPSSSTTQKQHH